MKESFFPGDPRSRAELARVGGVSEKYIEKTSSILDPNDRSWQDNPKYKKFLDGGQIASERIAPVSRDDTRNKYATEKELQTHFDELMAGESESGRNTPPAVGLELSGRDEGGDDIKKPEWVEGEFRVLVWYEKLGDDLREASRYVHEFKDRERTIPREEEIVAEEKNMRQAAKQRLHGKGVKIGILDERGGSRKVSDARAMIFEGKPSKTGQSVEDARKILDGMNIDVKRAREEGEKKRAEPPQPELEKDGQQGGGDDVAGMRRERGSKKTFLVESPEDLDRVLEDIGEIREPTARARRLGKLADQMFDEGKNDWGNRVSVIRAEVMKKGKGQEVRGIPENREDLVEWRKWARARISALLDPEMREAGKNTGNIFGATAETPFGRQNTDGSMYFPDSISDEVHGKFGDDGRVERVGELTASNEIGKIFSKWKESHRSLKLLEGAFDPQRAGEYKLPGNELNQFFLNELKGEQGMEGGGSKNIAKALRIYWAMAHNKKEEGKQILYNEGLEGITSIFDNPLSLVERNRIREQVAEKCGGIFYENVGLMYAGFFGVTAYGSDSTAPAIEYADAMGRLVYTGINRYSDEEEKTNPGKRAARYLNDLVANALIELNRDGGPVVREQNGVRDYVPVEIGVHPGNFQESLDGKYFYFVRTIDGRLECRKKLINGVDSNETLESLIKTGRINEVDWGNSDDLFAILKYREGLAVSVYKTFKNLDDDLAKLTVPEIVSRREMFDNAFPQYNIQTRQRVAYLWMYSLIAENQVKWTKEDTRPALEIMVGEAVEARLISASDADNLNKVFGVSSSGSFLKPFKEGKYRPVSLAKEIFGMIGIK